MGPSIAARSEATASDAWRDVTSGNAAATTARTSSSSSAAAAATSSSPQARVRPRRAWVRTQREQSRRRGLALAQGGREVEGEGVALVGRVVPLDGVEQRLHPVARHVRGEHGPEEQIVEEHHGVEDARGGKGLSGDRRRQRERRHRLGVVRGPRALHLRGGIHAAVADVRRELLDERAGGRGHGLGGGKTTTTSTSRRRSGTRWRRRRRRRSRRCGCGRTPSAPAAARSRRGSRASSHRRPPRCTAGSLSSGELCCQQGPE